MQETIIIGSIVLLLYLFNKYKKGVKKEMIVATVISLLWVTFSGIYGYRDGNFMFLGINLFPLFAWTASLVILREIYEKVKWKDKFVKVSLLYMALLIALEYVGYNCWGIQLTTNYRGLFGMELMHMPIYGKLYYLFIGPIYLKITDWMRVK